jgi:ferredoxin
MGRLTDVLLGLDLSDAALKGSAGAPAPAGELAPAAPAPAESAPAEEEAVVEAPPAPAEEEISFDEPWIDSMLCTSCDDCLAINKMMFAYNEDKQCFIKDAKAGTFAQLVQAAELCPAKCIHPGKPLNPGEPGLDELIKRAEPFN